MPKVVLWSVFAAGVASTGFMWHHVGARAPRTKIGTETEPISADRAEAAGLNPTRLIVDFKDDISAQALAAEPYVEVPVSAYSATDKLYRIDFANADEAAAAAAKLAQRSRGRERRLRQPGGDPARRGRG